MREKTLLSWAGKTLTQHHAPDTRVYCPHGKNVELPKDLPFSFRLNKVPIDAAVHGLAFGFYGNNGLFAPQPGPIEVSEDITRPPVVP